METGRQKAMDNLPKVMRPGNGETRAEAAAHDLGARLNGTSRDVPDRCSQGRCKAARGQTKRSKNAR